MSKGTFPPMGVTGTFLLKEPFKLDVNRSYTVKAIRSFDDLERAKVDPVNLVYRPFSLGDAEYSADRRNLARIYTLTGTNGEDTVYVPSTYILEYPKPTSDTHHWFHAIVSLGILPNDFDVTRVTEAIGNEVAKYIGVEPDVHLAVSDTTDVISPEEAILLEEARVSAIEYGSTLYKDKIELQARLDVALAQIHDMVGIIQDLTHE